MKQYKLQAAASLFTMVLILLSFSVATYAWFTNSPDTNVEPMELRAGTSGGSLLISSSRDGTYDVSCQLPVNPAFTSLSPVSTADLAHFFLAAGQSDDDTVTGFISGDDLIPQITLHGTVYLKAAGGAATVYFDPSALDFGTDVQALAALRLGLKFTTAAGVNTHIFRMDSFRDVTGALSKETLPAQYIGMVVQSASGGTFQMAPDPSVPLAGFCAQGASEQLTNGTNSLCTIAAEEICEVEYWLYLEGCDGNCFNEVQQRDAALQLGFFGGTPET